MLMTLPNFGIMLQIHDLFTKNWKNYPKFGKLVQFFQIYKPVIGKRPDFSSLITYQIMGTYFNQLVCKSQTHFVPILVKRCYQILVNIYEVFGILRNLVKKFS